MEASTVVGAADRVVAVVREYADRAHDAACRAGCPPEMADAVVEQASLDLVARLERFPHEVADPVAFLFRRCDELAAERARRAGGASTMPVDGGATRLVGALQRVPGHDERLLLLRDVYDVPPISAARALDCDVATLRRRLADARFELLAAYDGRGTPTLDGHPRTPPDLGALGAVADGSLADDTAVGLRRHSHHCPVCDDVVDAQARARRIAAALPLLGMPKERRDDVVTHVARAAETSLRSLEEVLLRDDDPPRPARGGPLIPPAVVALALVVALVAGVLVGFVTH